MSRSIRALKALAEDCREQGDTDIAAGIDGVVADVDALIRCIRAERVAADSQDSLDYAAARVVTSMAMVPFIDKAAQGGKS